MEDKMYKNISFFEFQKMFSTERKCESYFFKRRWSNGFSCPRCKHSKYYYHSTRKLYQCKNCGYQVSLRAQTIFHKSRLPLRKWFWAIYLITQNKNGISALQLQKQLDIGSYKTAWLMVHKIRQAMRTRDNNYSLNGLIELDDAYFGQKNKPGKRGRGSENKASVLAAVEVPAKGGPRFAFLKKIDNMSKQSVLEQIKKNVKEQSTFKTDGYPTYKSLSSEGYNHDPKVIENIQTLKEHLPWVHIILANMKNSIKSTFHGVSKKHLQRYLDEFTYRFNRRFNEKLLFDRLLFACTFNSMITYSELTE
jgi:transposase-like protein